MNYKFLQDKNLSWQAKGLLTYLLFNNDKITIENLKNKSKNGRDSTNTIMKELIKNGYIQKKIKQKEKGMFVGYEYIRRVK